MKQHIDYNKLETPFIKEKFQEKIKKQTNEIDENISQQQQWKTTCEIMENTAARLFTKQVKAVNIKTKYTK